MSRALLIVFLCAALAACGKSENDSPAGGGGTPTGGLDPNNLAAELIPPENGQLPADLMPPS